MPRAGETWAGAPRLELEGLAEVMSRDGRALDMPAGPTGPEVRRPGRLAVPLPQPHQRIHRILLTGPGRVSPILRTHPDHRLGVRAGNTAETPAGGGREV